MKIGIIGTGNMGSMLARAFAASPEYVVQVINRNPYKAEQLRLEVPLIEIASSIQSLVSSSDIVLLCTKPEDGKAILSEIGPVFHTDQILATTISSIPAEWIESLTQASVVKVIPSVTQTVQEGIILLSYGPTVEPAVQDDIEELFSAIGSPFVVAENQIRVCSDLSSCGPAFFAALCTHWAETAASAGQISTSEAEYLISQTLIGVAALLQEGFTLRDILDRVAIKGGVTEAGIAAVNKPARELFQKLHQATARHKKPPKIAKFTSA